MLAPLSWLKDFVDIDVSVEELEKKHKEENKLVLPLKDILILSNRLYKIF